MNSRVLLTIVLLAALAPLNFAQEGNNPFGIELNGGISFPVSNPGDTDLKPGPGFEAILHLRLMPHTGIYGGWGWNRMAADFSFAGDNVCFETTGYVIGLQFKHPVGQSDFSWLLRAGMLYSHIEIENTDGDITGDSGHGPGWQLAGGIDVPLGKGWSLTPLVTFSSLNREVTYGEVTTGLKHLSTSAKVAMVKTF